MNTVPMMLDENDVAHVIELLARRFPRSFSVAEKDRRPLKVGVYHELLEALGDSVGEFALSAALGSYCNSIGYLKRCRQGRVRIGLGGEPAGAVSAAEAKFARKARDRTRPRGSGVRSPT